MPTPTDTPRLPPRWFIRLAWAGHRSLLAVTRDRVGLATPTPGGRFGMLRLRTTGRHSGRERAAVVGYYEEGPALVTLAMNGWAEADPAWLLNLRANPDAIVDLPGGSRSVRARIAEGEERQRLWVQWERYGGYGDDVDAYARLRSGETAVVVLEPRPA